MCKVQKKKKEKSTQSYKSRFLLMISSQGLSSEYKQTGKAMHYCWRESIEVHCNTKTQMQSLSTDTWGKKKCMYIFWGILKPLEPLICQSSIQPVLCTIKTNQVNRNKIKHNSFIPLNMVTEQTCWQKAANTEGGGGGPSLSISVIPFLS